MRRRRGYSAVGRPPTRGPSPGAFLVLFLLTVAVMVVFWGPSLITEGDAVCLRDNPEIPDSISGTPRETTAAVAGATLECAQRVLIIDPTIHNVVAASRTAINNEAVLLAGSPAEASLVAGTIALLNPEVVWWPGHPNDWGGQLLPLDSSTRLETIELDPAAAPPEEPTEVTPAETIWLAPSTDPNIAELIRPVATLTGGAIGVIDINGESWTAPFEAADDAPFCYLGSLNPSQQWLLDGLLTGRMLPGGGTSIFPDRHLVAYYGSPGIESLGILGGIEGPEVALGNMAQLIDSYQELGVNAAPALELVATIASNTAGSDENYSTELSIEALRPWVDAAGELGAYVLLDLQPGRTDFLTQAQLYEELLTEPHVGLALDPAWRLKEGELHGGQIGTVSAFEVNEVIDWMAELSRANNLPQKVLMVHQSRPGVVVDRGAVTITPEVAVVFQSDGAGRLVDKQETYGQVTSGSAPAGVFWGWKNFYRTDRAITEPVQILGLSPQPYVITYQ